MIFSTGKIIQASEYVRSLESGLPSAERNKRWLMILQTFIDDSGTHGKEPFFSLGGFISTSDKWAQFADAWKAELDRKPSIPYFSMRSAFNPQHGGPFKGWKQRPIERKVSEFLKIIKNHAILRVSCSLRRDDYEEIVKRGLFPKSIDHPYFVCFWRLIIETVKFAHELKWNAPIDFIFDEQGKMGSETIKWYPYIKKVAPEAHKPYFGSPPIFRDDKIFLPLQAADLYAWTVRRNLRENKILYMPLRDELKSLWDMKSIDQFINSSDLTGMVDHMAKNKITEFTIKIPDK
jgi:hypothetical protein